MDDRAGLLVEADGGTLFIDEIGELPLTLQTKLLHALSESETRRIDDTHYTKFDTRVIAVTHCDLLKMVAEGTFRRDLYFRLAQMKLDVPPLRARGKVDIHALRELEEALLLPFAEARGVFDRAYVTRVLADSGGQ